MLNCKADGLIARTDSFTTSLPRGIQSTPKAAILKSLFRSFSTFQISWSTLTGIDVFFIPASRGLEKYLNFSLPLGQVTLKFWVPWASLRWLFWWFVWQTPCQIPFPLGKWKVNKKLHTQKENLLFRDNGTALLEPWSRHYFCRNPTGPRLRMIFSIPPC